MKKILLSLLILTFSFQAYSQSRLSRGPAQQRPGLGRTPPPQQTPPPVHARPESGCPSDKIEIVKSPNGLTFSVLFQDFTTQIKAPVQRGIQAKECNFSVPIQVPQNKRLVMTKVQYRGFANLPRTSLAQLKAFYRYSESERGRPDRVVYDRAETLTDRKLFGEMSDLFEVTQTAKTMKASCGKAAILLAYVRLEVRSGQLEDDAFVSLDSGDLSADPAITYELTLQDCK